MVMEDVGAMNQQSNLDYKWATRLPVFERSSPGGLNPVEE